MQVLLQFYKNLYQENHNWFKTALFWFVLATVLGVLTFFSYPDLLEELLNVFRDKFGENPALDFNLVWGIFQQNLIVSLIALFGGLLFGIGSVLVLVANGFILGYIVTSLFVINKDNFFGSLALVMAGIVPHGILELPIFILTSSLGLKFGLEYLNLESKGHRWEVFKANLKKVLFSLPLIALVLFIAALIEVFISGNLVGSF